MSPEYALYILLVTFSSFSLGMLAVSALLDFKMAPYLFALADWRGILKIGVMLIIGVLLWAVIPTKSIPSSVVAWVYVSGLFVAALGSFGVTIQTIRIYVELTVRKDNPLAPEAYSLRPSSAAERRTPSITETQERPSNDHDYRPFK